MGAISTRGTFAAALTAAALCLASVGPAAAAPGWSGHERISEAAAADPAVAIDDAGNALAVWSEPGWGAVHASFRAAGQSSFGPAQRISPDGGRYPRVGFDRDGNAVVVWSRLVTPDPERWVVEAVRRPSGGTFTEPQTITPQLEWLVPTLVELDVAAGGRAVLAFQGIASRAYSLWATLAEPGEPFKPPVRMHPRKELISNVDVGLGDDGTGAVTWLREVPKYPIVGSSDYYYEGVAVTPEGFTGVRPLEGLNGKLAVSSRGEAIYTTEDDVGVSAASAPPGGWFGERALVRGGATYGAHVFAFANLPQRDGSMALLIRQQDRFYEAVRPPNGSYGEAVELVGLPGAWRGERVTADRDGNMALSWLDDDQPWGEPNTNAGLRIVRRQVGGAAGPVEALTGFNTSEGYDVALGGAGQVLVIWSHSTPEATGTWVTSSPAEPAALPQAEPGPTAAVSAEPAQRPVTRKRVGLRISCPAACAVRLTGGVRTAPHKRFARLMPADLELERAGARTIRLDLSQRAASWIRDAIAEDSRVRVRVTLRAIDELGTARRLKREFWASP